MNRAKWHAELFCKIDVPSVTQRVYRLDITIIIDSSLPIATVHVLKVDFKIF